MFCFLRFCCSNKKESKVENKDTNKTQKNDDNNISNEKEINGAKGPETTDYGDWERGDYTTMSQLKESADFGEKKKIVNRNTGYSKYMNSRIVMLDYMIKTEYKLEIPMNIIQIIIMNSLIIVEFDRYDNGKLIETNIFKQIPEEFSIMGWVKPTRIDKFSIIAHASKGENEFRLQMHSGGYMALLCKGSNGWSPSLTTIKPLTINKWSHIALICNNNESKVYLNGKLDTCLQNCGENDIDSLSNTLVTFRIGSRHQGGSCNWEEKNNDINDPFYGSLSNWILVDCIALDEDIISHANVNID